VQIVRLIGVKRLAVAIGVMSSGSSEDQRQSRSRRLDPFEAVRDCKDIESFNEFARRYLDDRHLWGEDRRRSYWALFYAWKG
jgi:hypothetical protein